MSNQDATFPDGLIAKRNESAPDFVIVGLSFKTEEFIQWLRENDSNGWVNVKVNRSRGGKIYAQKDDWKPTQGTTAPNAYSAPQAQAPVHTERASEIPNFDDDNLEDGIPF